MIGLDDLQNRFGYHPPNKPGIAEAHEFVREMCFDLAVVIDRIIPDGREKSTAITKIEEAMMWANAAIARNPEGVSEEFIFAHAPDETPEATVTGDADRKAQA